MSKLAFTAMTLVGAAPAGFTLFLLVQHFTERGVPEMNLLGIMICVTMVMLFLVVITPFIVLIRYKSPAKPESTAPSKKGEAVAQDEGKKKAKGEDFGDALPEDFDEEELKASRFADDDIEDDLGDDFDDAGDDFEEIEEEEEVKPKAKGKAKKK